MGLESVTVCKVCGKEFYYVRRERGRKPVFCSPECKKKERASRNKSYFTERYRTDPDFRERRIRSNVAGAARRREAAKDFELEEIAKKLATMSDIEEIKTYLAKNMRLKSEVYNGPKEIRDGE